MKTILKSVLTLTLAAGLGIAANAQTVTANADASSTATVLTTITITNPADIAFGNVLIGDIPTLDASDLGSSASVGATHTLGKFTVAGTATASVLVTFLTTITMTNGESPAKALDFYPSVYRTHLTADSDGITSISTLGTYTINSSSTNALSGTDHFFVGGTLEAVGTGAIPVGSNGLYTGTFNLQVDYN